MDDFEREDGVSILDIIKVIFGRKILLLIVSLSAAIVLMLAILFGLNTMRQSYSATFSFADPNMIDGKYVDGSGFNYNSLIDRNNLERIKASNDLYKSINLDAMYENNGISVSVEEIYSIDELTLKSKVTSKIFTLKTNKKYYSSTKQARSFIKDIIETSTRTNTEKVNNLFYNSNLNAYDNAEILDLKLYYLKNQYNYILNRYKQLKEVYKDFVISSTNKSLTSYENEFKSAFYLSEYSVDTLNSDLVNNVYALDYAANEETYENMYTTYKTLYEANELKIEKISETLTKIIDNIKVNATEYVNKDSFDLSSYNTEIIEATLENIEYKDKITYYANVLGKLDTTDENYRPRATEEESLEFLSKLDATKEKLEEYTNIFRDVERGVLTGNNHVYFSNSNVVVVTGGLNTVVAIIVSIVLGVGIGCVVNLIVDFKKLTGEDKKEKKEEK